MTEPIKTNVTASTFQQLDGSNFTTAGVEASLKVGKGNLSIYGGIGTSFQENTNGTIIDFKGSTQYGNSCVSGGFRIRNNINESSQSVQVRIQPATVKLPLSEKTSIYTTPYIATKINCQTGETKTNVGNFTGVSTKIGKTNIFIEGQLYDVTKINKNTTSINAGISINI